MSVCDYDKFTQNEVIGRVTIPLKNNTYGLTDQNKKEIWLDLYERNGNLTGG